MGSVGSGKVGGWVDKRFWGSKRVYRLDLMGEKGVQWAVNGIKR